jgi:hypothetical protein
MTGIRSGAATHGDDLDQLSGNLSLTGSVELQVQLSDHVGGVYNNEVMGDSGISDQCVICDR